MLLCVLFQGTGYLRWTGGSVRTYYTPSYKKKPTDGPMPYRRSVNIGILKCWHSFLCSRMKFRHNLARRQYYRNYSFHSVCTCLSDYICLSPNVCLSGCLSVSTCLSKYLFVSECLFLAGCLNVSVWITVCLNFCLSGCLSQRVRLNNCLSLWMSVSKRVCLNADWVYLSTYLFVCRLVCLHVCLSDWLTDWLNVC